MKYLKGNVALPNIQEEQIGLKSRKKITNIKSQLSRHKLLLIVALFILSLAVLIVIALLIFDKENAEVIRKSMQKTKQFKISLNSQTSNKTSIKNTPPSQQISLNQSNMSIHKNESDNSVSSNLSQNLSTLFTSYSQNIINNRGIYLFLKKRIALFQHHLSSYKKSVSLQQKINSSQITRQQFSRAIELIGYSPLILNSQEKVQSIIEEEKKYYVDKYDIESYKEFQICVVVPTYKNSAKYRYFFNLYTILQQQYSKYHVVIIDDNSEDLTASKIQKQLRNTPFAQAKITLIKNKKRQFHMANIYHAVYNYCHHGEILTIIDGDDQLIGRQVFKVINAAYHRSKSFAIYTSHIQSKKDIALAIGISRKYPKEVIVNNSFRQVQHYYSHLKTAWVDLFLQINQTSLKSAQGVWYNNAVDNAIFLSIFEMSCGRVEYLPEITYKYNTFTGNTVTNMEYGFRKATADEIRNKPKYSCLNETKPDIFKKIESYFNDSNLKITKNKNQFI